MSTITEIESAIERLPTPQLDELAAWLDQHRAQCTEPSKLESWFALARGAAKSGTTTMQIMAITRGEE